MTFRIHYVQFTTRYRKRVYVLVNNKNSHNLLYNQYNSSFSAESKINGLLQYCIPSSQFELKKNMNTKVYYKTEEVPTYPTLT